MPAVKRAGHTTVAVLQEVNRGPFGARSDMLRLSQHTSAEILAAVSMRWLHAPAAAAPILSI